MQGAVTGGAELDSGFLGVSLELSSSKGWEGAWRDRPGGSRRGEG